MLLLPPHKYFTGNLMVSLYISTLGVYIQNPLSRSEYSILNKFHVIISHTGQNYVTAVDDTIFSATIYGAADREFYANPISLRLNPGTCTEITMVVGDGVDNDCDDQIDEEVCNGLGTS